MGLFDDILKGLPENAVLRAKVQEAEAQNAALSTENAILKDDNRKLKLENQKLKETIDGLSNNTDLDEIKIQIIKALAEHGGSYYKGDLEHLLQLQRTHLDYHMDELMKAGYLKESRARITMPTSYGLSSKGKEYAVKNNLV